MPGDGDAFERRHEGPVGASALALIDPAGIEEAVRENDRAAENRRANDLIDMSARAAANRIASAADRAASPRRKAPRSGPLLRLAIRPARA